MWSVGVWFLDFFVYFGDQTSGVTEVGLVKIFSHSVGRCFVLLAVSLVFHKSFSFRWSHLLIVSLSVHAAGVIFRKWFPVPRRSSALPTFSSIRFSVAGFRLRSLIHVDSSFVHGVHFHFSMCWYPVMPAPLVKYALFFPFDTFCFFIKDQVYEDVWIDNPGLLFGSVGPPVCS